MTPSTPKFHAAPWRHLAAFWLACLLCLPALAAEPLRIGSKRFTEAYILAQVVAQTAAPHAAVDVKAGLGNTAIVYEALRAGSIDLYPEYTGTIALEILKDPGATSLEAMRPALAKLGLGVDIPLGFNDGYALAMREDRAENAGRPITLASGGPAARVRGVGARLERVVENLLDNAVSFSPPDKAIEVALENDGKRVTLTVCDHGPGIPEEAREKVFQRFHSVRPAEEDFGNHSGLGLAIARAIAEAHDGTLTAEARPDSAAGACLKLRLPVAA